MKTIKHFSTKLPIISIIGLALLLPVSAIAFVFTSIESNMVPTSYLVVAVVISFALSGLAIYICAKQNCPTVIKVVSATFDFLLALSLFIASGTVANVSGVVNDITQDIEYYDEMVMVALKDSKVIGMEELDGKRIGIQTQTHEHLAMASVEKLQEEYDVVLDVEEYRDIAFLVDALFHKKVDAIIYHYSFTDLLAEQIDGYAELIKIIECCKLTESDVERYYKDESELPMESTPKPIEPPTSEDTEPAETITATKSNVFAVYLSGIDVYGSISKKSRSDVNILAIINPDDREVLLVTTPRDYYVEIPNVSNGQKDKLTHAGIYGVQASMDTLSNLYGIDIDYYFRVNFTSFEKIIDALGGVSVYSEHSFFVDGYSFKKGYNDVDGKSALRFARERKTFADGDHQRGKNQLALIKAIISKACSPVILTAINDILDSVRDNVDTNIPETIIQDMIRSQLVDNKAWKVTTLAANGFNHNDVTYSMPSFKAYVMLPDMNSISKIKSEILKMYN